MIEPVPPPRLPLGYTLHSFDAIDSTNAEAKRLARSGAATGTIVWARTQSAGRGRHNREWISPSGNLYLSILLYPDTPRQEMTQLSFVAGLVVLEAISNIVPDLAGRLTLKWPNDVLLDGAKCAGLLLESDSDGWLIIGIGVNIASAPVITGRTTSCLGAVSLSPPTARFAEAIVARWDTQFRRWETQGFPQVRERWLAHAAYLGEQIAVTLGEETVTGIFEGLKQDGGLLLRDSDGALRHIMAGDVFAASQAGS